MCTPTVAAVATAVAATATVASATGLIGPKPIKPSKVKPPDLAAEERRKQARLLQKQIAGGPGPGRASTIVAGATTGTGNAALKQKTGQ